MQKLGNKIMLIGPGGSGKSTLAQRLGEITKLPVIYLDKERKEGEPQDAWLSRMHEFTMGECWIIDGNMGVANMDERMAHATSIIFLDFSPYICLWRGFSRHVWQHMRKQEREDGCPAQFDRTFVKWVWQFPKVQRIAIHEKLDAYRDKRIILRNPREVRALLKQAHSLR